MVVRVGKMDATYVLWMDYKGHRLTPTEAQELLQTGRLGNPITIDEGNSKRQVLVYLGELGQVLEIFFPIPSLADNEMKGKQKLRK